MITGFNMPEAEFTSVVLMSLPPSWDSFISTINGKDLESMDPEVSKKATDSIFNQKPCAGNCNTIRWDHLHSIPRKACPIQREDPTKQQLNVTTATKRDIGHRNARSILLMKRERMQTLPPKKERANSQVYSVAQIQNPEKIGLAIQALNTISYKIAIHLLNTTPFLENI